MDEKILREILVVAKENNDLLKKLNNQRRLMLFLWFFKWGVFIIIAYSAYVAATPYIESAQQTINNINDLNNQAKQFQGMDQRSFSDFLSKQLKKVTGQ